MPDIAAEVAADVVVQVLGDAQLTKSALMNLMDNGCKYSGRKEALVEVCGGNHQLSITFTDHGIGIPEADMEHLFEPFHTTDSRGTGLGLYIARELCEANGATIGYRRGADGGACFYITFGDGVDA